MKHLLTISLLAFLLSVTVSCDSDNNNTPPPQMPIKNLVMPDQAIPLFWGESVTIQGEGFIENSELWIGEVDKKKAAIAARNSSGITFVVPEGVEGLQNIILRQTGADWLIGKLTFKAPALMPIKNLQMPDTNTPILGGTTVVILGEGFVESSEIWMQEPEDANIKNKTVVTQVNGSQISFTAPEQANGLKKIILKQDNKEWELGQLTFKTLEMKPPKYFVAKMGTLGTTVLNQKQKDTITVMQLYGEINASDFSVLRSEMKKLQVLDLSEVTCQDNAIPTAAFMDGFASDVKKISLPKNLKRIENAAFALCGFSLESPLVIPDGVTYIGEIAFAKCYGLHGDLVIPSSVTYIGEVAFAKCSGFTSLSLPDGLTTLGAGAFGGCSGFAGSLTIPDGVTSIGKETFVDCKGFTGSLILPSGVTSIGRSAFARCSGFTGTLTLPSSLKTIDEYAFFKCEGFKGNLTIPNSVTSIGGRAFAKCSGFNGRLTLSDQLKIIEPFTFAFTGGREPVGSFTGLLAIPNGVTVIDTCAFQCAGFDGTLTLSESLLTIEDNAFYECGFTGSLTIPDGVKTISENAFADCKKFDGQLTLSKELISIEKYAFRYCGFTGLTLPDKLKTMGYSAFDGCGNLSGTLTIPVSVTIMDRYVFDNCKSLKKIRLSWSAPIPAGINQLAFDYEAVLEVPNELLPLYREWGKNCHWFKFIGY